MTKAQMTKGMTNAERQKDGLVFVIWILDFVVLQKNSPVSEQSRLGQLVTSGFGPKTPRGGLDWTEGRSEAAHKLASVGPASLLQLHQLDRRTAPLTCLCR